MGILIFMHISTFLLNRTMVLVHTARHTFSTCVAKSLLHSALDNTRWTRHIFGASLWLGRRVLVSDFPDGVNFDVKRLQDTQGMSVKSCSYLFAEDFYEFSRLFPIQLDHFHPWQNHFSAKTSVLTCLNWTQLSLPWKLGKNM